MAGLRVSEYVTRGVIPASAHFHVDTTRSDTDEFVTDSFDTAVAALSLFAQRVTREFSFAKWTSDASVVVQHADAISDFGRIWPCSDPACELSERPMESYLSDDDPLDAIASDFDVVAALEHRSLEDAWMD